MSADAALMARADPGCTVPVTDRATDVAVLPRDDITLDQVGELRADTVAETSAAPRQWSRCAP